jgi:acyl-CoA synthetase (AMP-forming)/AMP-acid ligase II
LYRVFRAFDHLVEEEAAAECSRVLRRDRVGMAIDAGSFGLCAMLACSLGSCLVGAWVIPLLPREAEGWGTGVVVAGGLAFVVTVSYLAAAWRYQRLGAMVLGERLGPANDRTWNICAKCSYPLNDLPVERGRVVCPECGGSYPWLDDR